MTDPQPAIRRRTTPEQLRYLAGKLIEAHDRLHDVNQTHSPERVTILAVAIALDGLSQTLTGNPSRNDQQPHGDNQ